VARWNVRFPITPITPVVTCCCAILWVTLGGYRAPRHADHRRGTGPCCYPDRENWLRRLMPQRFLLREIWERLDLDVAAGVRFAKNDPNVVAFWQLLLHKVVQILR
jgi:hypothetical protein